VKILQQNECTLGGPMYDVLALCFMGSLPRFFVQVVEKYN
jgi:hypothetical protein